MADIKVPGILKKGSGDHWGEADGLKDMTQGKMQSVLNAQFVKATDYNVMTKDTFDAMTEEQQTAAKNAHEWLILTE